MEYKKKSTLFSKHNLGFALAFVLVALIVGIYFLFKPFPAGPSLDVKANAPAAASAVGWSAYANAPVSVSSAASMPSSVREFASSQQRNFGPASVAGWSAYANAPVVVKEAASVVGWSAYANPPTIVDIAALRQPMHNK